MALQKKKRNSVKMHQLTESSQGLSWKKKKKKSNLNAATTITTHGLIEEKKKNSLNATTKSSQGLLRKKKKKEENHQILSTYTLHFVQDVSPLSHFRQVVDAGCSARPGHLLHLLADIVRFLPRVDVGSRGRETLRDDLRMFRVHHTSRARRGTLHGD